MTLSQRTIIVIAGTFTALLFILAVSLDLILLRSYSILERSALEEDVKKVRGEINESYDYLDLATRNLFQFYELKNRHSSFRFSDKALINNSVDISILYSRSGEVVSALEVDFHKKQTATLPDVTLVLLNRVFTLASNEQDGNLNGFMLIGDKPLQLVMRLNPATGTRILAGRYLDSDEVGRITALTGLQVKIFRVDSVVERESHRELLADFEKGVVCPSRVTGENSITGYSLFRDLFGQPVFMAGIVEQRLLHQQGKAAITYVVMSLFLAGGVFCCVILFFIRSTVMRRIEQLNATVKGISFKKDISSRLPDSSEKDELGVLSFSINEMLESLETAENALRESEERHRILFEKAPDSIFIIEFDEEGAGRIVSANKAASDQHGYSVQELCGMKVSDLNTEENSKISDDLFRRILGGEWVTHEVWHRKKGGGQFPVEIHAGLVKINGHNYILDFGRDITSRKLAEELNRMHLDRIRQLNVELNRHANDLAAANNELEAFNYSVSHDMRGPLTRISGYCQLILDQDSQADPQIRHYATRINEAGQWLNDMIDSLLNLAKLTRSELVSEKINLSSMVDSIILEMTLNEPGRRFKKIVEKDVEVKGDSSLIKVLMYNLIENAWKYSSQESETVIEFGVCHDGEVPVYFVSDNGAGFDMQHYDRLFRVFTRLHDSSRFKGCGIGLATVQRIVTRHGGRVWAKSEVGNGSTFFFTLQPDNSPAKLCPTTFDQEGWPVTACKT